MKEQISRPQEKPRVTVVVTTIQPPTAGMRAWSELLGKSGYPILVVGDRRGPFGYPLSGAECLTIEQQLRLPFSLARLLPVGHYSRKNLGYLVAMRRGTGCIYETDDDNAPLPTWKVRQPRVPAVLHEGKGWVNVYRQYSKEKIWPRGLPLDAIHRQPPDCQGPAEPVEAPIQQGLANGSPDVDAVWRLVFGRPIEFDQAPSLALPSHAWCPFNSQSTWWWPEAYRLMYLPSHCSFRMTDIWRSFVAQRCLWPLGKKLVFHPAEVSQARNSHNLMRDFEHEIQGYLNNDKIRETLDALPLNSGLSSLGDNLACCYEALVREGIFPKEELGLVAAWLEDAEFH